MKVLRPKDKGYKKSVAAALNRRLVPDPKVRAVVAKILSDIEAKGDAALLRYTKKFGGPSLTPAQIPVAPAETARAIAELDPDVRRAISAARANVRNFARRSLRKSWFMKNRQGAVVGERFDPFQRVGIYVPGGTAPLVSSAIMTCTLAAAAGVPEIVAVTPAEKSGGVHPALLAALAECGATEIDRVGGAQAVAALACGTKTDPAGPEDFRSGECLCCGSEAPGFRASCSGSAARPERGARHRRQHGESEMDRGRSPGSVRAWTRQPVDPRDRLAENPLRRGEGAWQAVPSSPNARRRSPPH